MTKTSEEVVATTEKPAKRKSVSITAGEGAVNPGQDQETADAIGAKLHGKRTV